METRNLAGWTTMAMATADPMMGTATTTGTRSTRAPRNSAMAWTTTVTGWWTRKESTARPITRMPMGTGTETRATAKPPAPCPTGTRTMPWTVMTEMTRSTRMQTRSATARTTTAAGAWTTNPWMPPPGMAIQMRTGMAEASSARPPAMRRAALSTTMKTAMTWMRPSSRERRRTATASTTTATARRMRVSPKPPGTWTWMVTGLETRPIPRPHAYSP